MQYYYLLHTLSRLHYLFTAYTNNPAHEVRLANICLTCEAELARPLPSEAKSKGRDKPLRQVEAIVRNIIENQES